MGNDRNDVESLKIDVDNYLDSIFAIIGILMLCKFEEPERPRRDVQVFQGIRLTRISGSQNENDVEDTPDFGACKGSEHGFLGEVKMTLPRDSNLWKRPLEQFLRYADEHEGWPTSTGKVDNHYIVLIVRYMQSREICRKLELMCENVTDAPQYCVIEYSRQDQLKKFITFRTEYGDMLFEDIGNEFRQGISVPANIEYFSAVKLYDADPPIQHLMQLIWQYVVTPEAISKRERGSSKTKTTIIRLNVDDICTRLRREHSFSSLSWISNVRERSTPRRKWTIKACEYFVNAEDAKWLNESKSDIEFKFIEHDDIKEHCCELVSESKGEQMDLGL